MLIFMLLHHILCEFDLEINGTKLSFKEINENKVLLQNVISDSEGEFYLNDTFSFGDSEFKVIGIMSKAFSETVFRKVTLKGEISRIEEYAFDHCSYLNEVNLSGSSVEIIDSYAFSYTFNLEKVFLPDTLVEIGEKAFLFSGIKHIDLPDSILEIKNQAFRYSHIVRVELPTNIHKISYRLFSNCKYLCEVRSRSFFTHISKYAFYATNISYFDFTPKIKSLSVGCFSCSTIVEADLSMVHISHIPAKIFCNCSNLLIVKLSSFITTINEFAFASTSIQNVSFSWQLDTIKDFAFYNSSIRTVNLPKNFKSLGAFAYANCLQLKTFDFSASALKVIPHSCFKNCTSLVTIIPNNERLIFHNDSLYNSGIIDFNISNHFSIHLQVFGNCMNLRSVNLINVENDVLPNATFIGCVSLVKVILPDGIKGIYSFAFKDCISLSYMNIESTNITHIGAYSFANTSRFRFNFPSSVKSLEEYSFAYSFINAAYMYDFDLKTIPRFAFYMSRSLEAVSLPKNLRSISEFSFYGTSIKQVEIPSSVKRIGDFAFCNCEKLREVVFYTLTLTSLGVYSFSNTSISVFDLSKSKLKMLPQGVFQNSSLQVILLPQKLSVIGPFALAQTRITSIEFSLYLTTLSLGSFEESDLETIDFRSSSIAIIPERCFFKCYKLNSVIFGGSTSSIGTNSFSYTKVAEISLGSCIRTISPLCFSNCNFLVSVDMSESSLSVIPERSFYRCPLIRVVYLPLLLSNISALSFDSCPMISIVYYCGSRIFDVSVFPDKANLYSTSKNLVNFKLISSYTDFCSKFTSTVNDAKNSSSYFIYYRNSTLFGNVLKFITISLVIVLTIFAIKGILRKKNQKNDRLFYFQVDDKHNSGFKVIETESGEYFN